MKDFNSVQETDSETAEIYDVLGLGFGPSNLSLAAVIEEESEARYGRKLKTLFIERQPNFAWQPGMLLEGAQIQLSFLKDLVTLRNPQSRFTFLCYLQAKGRLDQFINLREFFPTRVEFNDYYSWIAEQLRDQVRYGGEVVSVNPVAGGVDEKVELVRVDVRDVKTGRVEAYLARNLVVATGGVPILPSGVELQAGGRVFHSQNFLRHLTSKFPDREKDYRFVVVGSGQSAAEIFQYLFVHYPNARVTSTIRRFAFKPADDSHFVNEIFFPQMEDFIFSLPEEKRQVVLAAHRDTNYSAVDAPLIQQLYQALYERSIVGDDKVQIRPFLELQSVDERDSGVVLKFRDVVREETEEIEADGAVLATGFDRPKKPALIDELAPYLQVDATGRYDIERNYRVRTQSSFLPGLFLQGFCEDSHGLSDTLLSTLPIRSAGIFEVLSLDEERLAENQREHAVSLVRS
jgi:L-ornithine N5-oxygenase